MSFSLLTRAVLLAVGVCYSVPEPASASYCHVPLPLPNPGRAPTVRPAAGGTLVAEHPLPDQKRGAVMAFGKRKPSAALFAAPGRVDTAVGKPQEVNVVGLSILALPARPDKAKLPTVLLPTINPRRPSGTDLSLPAVNGPNFMSYAMGNCRVDRVFCHVPFGAKIIVVRGVRR